MNQVVMDSSVIIACILDEPGADYAYPLLPFAHLSTVNMAEVVTRFSRYGSSSEDIHDIVRGLPVQTEAFDAQTATLAGLLEAKTREFGLSLGDRACLALGLTLQLPIITADRAWKSVSLPVEIRLIR
jgi:ribonuclease VapC